MGGGGGVGSKLSFKGMIVSKLFRGIKTNQLSLGLGEWGIEIWDYFRVAGTFWQVLLVLFDLTFHTVHVVRFWPRNTFPAPVLFSFGIGYWLRVPDFPRTKF